jgi:LCP family protein required for cell wall assembly
LLVVAARPGRAGDGELRVDEHAPEQDESDESGSALPSEADPEPVSAPVQHGAWWRDVSLGVGRAFAALLSIAVLGTMGYGWWAVGDVDEKTVTTDVIPQEVTDQRIPLDGAVDMLLVGMDSRTDANGKPLPREVLDMLHAGINDGERNTDTMILVHIPVDGTRAVAISFPRDSWVQLAGGFGNHKLNSAFAYAWLDARGDLGKTVKDPKELEAQAAAIGRKNLIATIENLIGKAVTIDRYAEVNLLSFYEITKAIGGVQVCLNEPVNEWRSGANFPAGVQTIDGAAALAFVRQRHELPNGDLDRIVRQQVFLGALADKVLSADMLTSPSKVHELVSAVQRSVILSKGWELTTFAAQMQSLSSGNIDFYTIPTEGPAKIGGADVIKVDPAKVHQFVASLTNDGSVRSATPETGVDVPGSLSPTTTTTPTTTSTTATRTTSPPRDTTTFPTSVSPSSVTVDVRNASETKGLAATVQERLVQQGFHRGTTGDAPVQAVSVIRYASGEQYSAQLVASALGGQLALEPDLSLPVAHVQVLIGTDYRSTQGLGRAVNRIAPTSPTAPSTSTPPPPPIVAGSHTCVN